MRILILLALVSCTSYINFVNATERTTDPIVFKVNTLRMNMESDSVLPLPKARLIDIMPIGRGNASDLECEGVSDDKGEMTCVVNSCNKTSLLTNTYHIAIQAPNEFGEMKPAQVKVFQCDVIPTTASAMFIEKTLIAKKFNSDVQYVFGMKTAAVLNGQASITVEQYTDKMSSLLKKPAGSFSAIKMRKIFQDNSLDAVKSNEAIKAIEYSGLVISHANIWLNEWAQQNRVTNMDASKLDSMATLHKNIKIILENSDNRSVLVHKEQLTFLKESIEKGKLANNQLKALESISIK